ncbi:MAG: AbrB/MazE/SpoVT family DNA-binding domain-containing protein [bacterium]|nr:AbrB/MazE/SpoVT family DNA-binding domain-containing protein [bacterium]
MTQIATITSKKQLTLPAELFRKAGFRIGQKLVVSEENGRLILTPAEKLVEEFGGSVSMPKRWMLKTNI